MSLPNTHHGPEGIARILEGAERLFFAGIGGVSMNALAHISHLRGYRVSGYDRTPSELTHKLEAAGVTVYYEEDARHVADADALIYTVAMPETNAEYAAARDRGIPLISRADFLGWLMTGYRCRIGVSGTHGKSTTTGMLSRIFGTAGKCPTVLNGAPMKESGSVDIIGGEEYFIFEACEYMDSFLDFNPTISVVLNVELDHVDYFHSIEQIRESFAAFVNRSAPGGTAILNLDDANCRLLAPDCLVPTVTFGRCNPDADYSSANETLPGRFPAFDVLHHGKKIAHVALQIPGQHNISDALAAFAAASAAGLDPDAIAAGLSAYEGIKRRMEKIGLSVGGAAVYSDYAHHPTEIAATLKGARPICPGKLRVVFQPHTFSRTAELFDGFVAAFADSPADEVIFCEIYPARETNVYGVSSAQLAEHLGERGKPARAASSFAEAAEWAAEGMGPGDMILVMGAGDVTKIGDLLVKP